MDDLGDITLDYLVIGGFLKEGVLISLIKLPAN